MQSPAWRDYFPDLDSDAGLDACFAQMRCLSIPAGTRVFEPESSCQNHLLVASVKCACSCSRPAAAK